MVYLSFIHTVRKSWFRQVFPCYAAASVIKLRLAWLKLCNS